MTDTAKNPIDAQGESGADSERETSLVPASLFGGNCSVGDTYTVKVVGKYDDDLEVEHVPDKTEEKSEEGTMKEASSKLDMMAQPEGGY